MFIGLIQSDAFVLAAKMTYNNYHKKHVSFPGISILNAQDPSRIGFTGIRTMVNYLNGEIVEPNINIDVQIIIRDNINDPKNLHLLSSEQE